jgi:hypothetical protein
MEGGAAVISASQLLRVINCPGSESLSHASLRSEWADSGTKKHAELEEAINAGEVPEELAEFIPDGAKAEVKLAYDVASGEGRVIGYGSDRDYGELGPFEIPGGADSLLDDGERVHVIDAKSGWMDVPRPRDNPQLMFLGLAAARAFGRDEAKLTVLYVREGQKPFRVVDTVDVLDLDAFASKLRGIHRRVAEQVARIRDGRMPDVTEGQWCRYCPAAHACPAKTALVRRMVSGDEASELEMMIPLDDATARLAYERLGHAKNLLKRIERVLYARAAEQPIPLGEGRYFGKRRKMGNESLVGDVVYRVMRERYGQAVADQAVTREATKKALKEALGKVVGKGQVANEERAVLDMVRSNGGSKREEKEAVEEYMLEEVAQ